MTVYLDPLENFVINLYVVVRTKRWNAQRFVFFCTQHCGRNDLHENDKNEHVL